MRVGIFIREKKNYFRRFLSRSDGILLNRISISFIFVESRRGIDISVDVDEVITSGIVVT